MATSLSLLGLAWLVVIVDRVNHFRLMGVVGLQLGGGPLRTASFLVMPLGFGVAASCRRRRNKLIWG